MFTYLSRCMVILRKVVRKSARDNTEGCCEWFWVQRSSKKFERMALEPMDICLRVLKDSSKSKFDSYSHQEQCIDHIPYYFSGLSLTHFFRKPFLEIAVYVTGQIWFQFGIFSPSWFLISHGNQENPGKWYCELILVNSKLTWNQILINRMYFHFFSPSLLCRAKWQEWEWKELSL